MRRCRAARTPFERLRRCLAGRSDLIVSDLDLTGIDLRRRALLGVEFRRCDLASAAFAGADLSFVRFVDCNLYLADFSDAVLYTTWFHECNLTKAQFSRSFLLGLRLRNVDLTKVELDLLPLVGLERKVRDDLPSGVLRVGLLGSLPHAAPAIEDTFQGIRMDRDDRTIAFLRSGDSPARRHIRLAETARYLRIAYAGNGNAERARHYHVLERRQRRKALQGSPANRARRVQDFVFGELVWRYGTSVLRPVLSLTVIALLAAAVTFAAPSVDGDTGLHPDRGVDPYGYRGLAGESVINYLNVLYYFLTGPAGGSQDSLHGWVKVIFVGYLLAALWLIALTFDAFTRRTGSAS